MVNGPGFKGQQKTPNAEAVGVLQARFDLAFRELEATTRTGLTGFLTFLHTRIAGQEAGLLEVAAETFVDLKEGAGNAVAQRAGLADHSATFADGGDIEGADTLNSLEGGFDKQA